MKSLQKLIFTLATALALGRGVAQAQTPPTSGAATQGSTAAEFSEGEVRNVDKAGKKITLKHGEIKNLGMAPMAMVFQVADPALLDKVKNGDKVRFKAVHQSGKYVVTQIQAAR